MRRLLSTVLLVSIGFWLIAPALPLDQVQRLPACCRPGGKHHCTMPQAGDSQTGASDANSGPAFGASGERCPFAPFLATSVPNWFGFLPSTGHALVAPTPRSAVRLAPESDYCGNYAPNYSGRGPPTPLA